MLTEYVPNRGNSPSQQMRCEGKRRTFSKHTYVRGTTDFRYTRHLDDRRRAQTLVDVDNHMAWRGHLRAALCPTAFMCTPFA